MTVSLSVHKNKIEARRKRELAKALRRDVEGLVKETDIRAYAIVGIAADGKGYALWDTGAIIPQWAFADVIGGMLRRDVELSDVEDDWRPTLARGKSE